MPPFTEKEVARGLKKKGFKRKPDRKHIFYHFYYNGIKTSIHTWMSHNQKECDDSLLGFMAKQLYLKRKEFNSLLECPLTKEDYIKLMIRRGHIAV